MNKLSTNNLIKDLLDNVEDEFGDNDNDDDYDEEDKYCKGYEYGRYLEDKKNNGK